MPTPVGGGKKNKIKVIVTLVDGRYEAEGRWVDRIGDKRKKRIKWEFKNRTGAPLAIAIGQFSPSNPCPVTGGDFSACQAAKKDVTGRGDIEFEAVLNEQAAVGSYTYEIHASNPDTGTGNTIDPELQIDGHSFRVKGLVIGGLIVAAAIALYLVFGR